MSLRSYISLFLLVCGVTSVVAVNRSCELYSETSCDACLKNSSCLWCITGKKCITYPPGMILPSHSLCPLNDARWGLCAINFQGLIITLAMLAAALIIAFFICLFWYCRCENCRASMREKRKQRQESKRSTLREQRKAETMARHGEIQQKYGLSGLRKASTYSKFENI
ncbi:PTTG1 interacting protein a [Trichomycterus rosablanca]|uniref:PTTG1 interacting protein a n=1 Tax=Trichomycterus rosablanca TaxID=2290929 RepID=UPI002F35AB5C